MQFKKTVAALALAGTAQAAGRPNGTSICDYYTTALLKDNNATNQATLLTLLVNTAVIGNYTKPKIEGVTWPDVAVNGILNKGTINGTEVNLLPYFDGGLASSNRGKPVAINFLDDGGAVPLMMNMPANGTSSNQYKLLTHLYEFFGTLLGCSQQGMKGFDSYQGQASMFAVHKYMDLDYAQMSYFIEQVALSAASFGVAMSDIQDVGKALNGAFNYRCSPMITLAPALGSQLQSICIAPDCPEDPKADCSLYPEAVMPAVANSTLAMGEGNSSATATGSTGSATGGSSSGGSSPMSSSVSQAGADHVIGSTMATFLGFLAFLL